MRVPIQQTMWYCNSEKCILHIQCQKNLRAQQIPQDHETKEIQHHHTTTEEETMNAILSSYRKSPSTLQSIVTEHTWSLTLQRQSKATAHKTT